MVYAGKRGSKRFFRQTLARPFVPLRAGTSKGRKSIDSGRCGANPFPSGKVQSIWAAAPLSTRARARPWDSCKRDDGIVGRESREVKREGSGQWVAGSSLGGDVDRVERLW